MKRGVRTDVERATHLLEGIVAGVACDYAITDGEIAALSNWLALHENLLARYPFSEIATLLREVLRDQVVEEHEREELLDWCQTFNDNGNAANVAITQATRRLHGVLAGVALDGTVSAQELLEVREWLRDHERFRGEFPFADAWDLLQRILDDGVVSPEEHRELLLFCEDFSERKAENPMSHDEPDAASAAWMASDAPILETIDGVCEDEPVILFASRNFCFTGKARFGKRAELVDLVEGLGGSAQNRITDDLDYLVIGALSQPAWAFSSYGRKIEAVIRSQREGGAALIIREDDFLAAAGAD